MEKPADFRREGRIVCAFIRLAAVHHEGTKDTKIRDAVNDGLELRWLQAAADAGRVASDRFDVSPACCAS